MAGFPLNGRFFLAFGLAFVAGWCDITSLIRFQVFSGMQTGNLIKAGVELGFGRPLFALFSLVNILANVLGVMLYEAIESTGTEKPVYTMIPVTIGLFLIGFIWNQAGDGDKWQAVFISCAMGIQNGLGVKPSSKIGINTTFISGTAQKVAGAIYRKFKFGTIGDAATQETVFMAIWVLLGTLCAVIVAGFTVAAGVDEGYNSWRSGLPRDSSGKLWWTYLPPLLIQCFCYYAHDKIELDWYKHRTSTGPVTLQADHPKDKQLFIDIGGGDYVSVMPTEDLDKGKVMWLDVSKAPKGHHGPVGERVLYQDHKAGDIIHFEYLPGKFVGVGPISKDMKKGETMHIEIPKADLKPKKKLGKGHTGQYKLEKAALKGQHTYITTGEGTQIGFIPTHDMAAGDIVWIEVDHSDKREAVTEEKVEEGEAYDDKDVEGMGTVEHMGLAEQAMNVFTWL